MIQTLFWNVDTQYDFMRNDAEFKGALAIDGACQIEGNLETLTALAAARGIQVVNTADDHNADSEEIAANPDFHTTFPAHCLKNTPGAAYVPATKPWYPYVIPWEKKGFDAAQVQAARNIVLCKDKFDVFAGNPNTDDVVRLLKPDRVVVYGVATNVCVDFAVKGLRARGIDVYVPMDAIKEIPGLPVEPVYAAWRALGAKLGLTKGVDAYLRNGAV